MKTFMKIGVENGGIREDAWGKREDAWGKREDAWVLPYGFILGKSRL